VRRIAAGLLGAILVLGITSATPAQAAGNRVCHSDPNIHAVAIQIAYSGESWTTLRRGYCSTSGRTVQRMRSRAITSAFFCWYGECPDILHRMAEEPSTGTQLNGRSASVRYVKVR
jgi:hypothetical protein